MPHDEKAQEPSPLPNVHAATTTILSSFQAGKVNKTATGTLVVTFPFPFTVTPVVIVTPFWPVGTVSGIETVIAVTPQDFTLSSNNAAPNYFVNWVAFGRM